jgi:hypothetical protein
MNSKESAKKLKECFGQEMQSLILNMTAKAQMIRNHLAKNKIFSRTMP